MGTRNKMSVARPCCDGTPPPPEEDCWIDDGWECDVKDNILDADLTGWSLIAGTWNATQTWEAGTTADTLTTASSSAQITCDAAQPATIDGRMTVRHWIKLGHAADEAVITLAGYTVTVKAASISISGGGSTLASVAFGIGTTSRCLVYVCTWYDDDTELEYIGVSWPSSTFPGYLMCEATLGADGTTSFGTGSVTGSVSFQHYSTEYRDGMFANNGTRGEVDCKTCSYIECPNCPGGDRARYLVVDVTGFASLYGYGCSSCGDGNGSYVFDLSQASLGPQMGCSELKYRVVTLCQSVYIFGRSGYSDYYLTIAVYLELYGAGWRLRVAISEELDSTPYGAPYQYITQDATYEKVYTSADLCTDIDDDLSLAGYTSRYPIGCAGFNGLTVHVTATE